MNTGLGKRLAWTGLSDGVTGFIIYSVISLILATLSYRYIETLFFSRSKKVNQNRKTDGLIADK
jgi:peptidoglycan/LPS O-acetylase OafA/YrhL